MALSKEEIFKEQPSEEEITYDTAVELMDAVDCVERFERAVQSLRSAAEKLESLGEYKDAPSLRKQAIEQADRIEQEGCETTYRQAEKMREAAKDKSEYIAAASEYRRLKGFASYKEKGVQGEALCQKSIRRNETKRVYMRRGIALVVLAAICIIVMQTPLAFVVKGLGHKTLHQYRAAIQCYNQVDYLPGVNKMKRTCYYKIAKDYDEDNHHKKAMKIYRKAGAYADAEYRTTRYQKRFIRKAEKGDTVYYAGIRWVMLEKDEAEEKVLLIKKSALQEEDFTDGKILQGKELKEYLNGSYTNANFNDREKVMMGKKVTAKKRAGVETVQVEPEDEVDNPLFIMSETQMHEHEYVLPEEWDGTGIHPAVWVNYH